MNESLPENFEAIYRKRTFEEFEKSLQPIPGIHDLLSQLNIPFCVASNAPRNKVEFNLKLTNLFPFFENKIFSAYDMKKWKPDPTLFLTAAKTMGFAPADCLVVEDSPSGVKAAVAAGMKVLGYAANEKKAERLAKEGAIVIREMKEVSRYI